jgi:enterochelin esterase-like enzyme
VALKRFSGSPGRLVTVEHQSALLRDNPLGDPSLRQFPVWLPAGYDQQQRRGAGKRFPVLFDLAGYTSAGPAHTAWRGFDENVPERAARLIHQHKMPACIIVFPDCFTALGGNQYINSSALGPYADYLTRELIPFIDREFRTLAQRESRGVFGKSSGGYGALLHGMKYTRFWGAVASHSGDAYFDFIYRSDWPNTLTQLARFRPERQREGRWTTATGSANTGEDDGRVAAFLRHAWKRERLNPAEMHCLMNLCMAATYDPDPTAANGFRVPFDLETGELLAPRWRAWLRHDPVKLVRRHAASLRKLAALYIDCGWRDQYHIHYGCRQVAQQLAKHAVAHEYREFDGTHSGIDHRLDHSLPYLLKALHS